MKKKKVFKILNQKAAMMCMLQNELTQEQKEEQIDLMKWVSQYNYKEIDSQHTDKKVYFQYNDKKVYSQYNDKVYSQYNDKRNDSV